MAIGTRRNYSPTLSRRDSCNYLLHGRLRSSRRKLQSARPDQREWPRPTRHRRGVRVPLRWHEQHLIVRSAATTMPTTVPNPRRTKRSAGKSAAGHTPPSIGSPFWIFLPNWAEVQSLFTQGQPGVAGLCWHAIRPDAGISICNRGSGRFRKPLRATLIPISNSNATATLDNLPRWVGADAGRQNPIYLRGHFPL